MISIAIKSVSREGSPIPSPSTSPREVRWEVSIVPQQPISQIFAKATESSKDESYVLELPPVDVQRLILKMLDLRSLVGLYCTNKYWKKFVKEFLEWSVRLPISERSPLHVQMLNLIAHLREEYSKHSKDQYSTIVIPKDFNNKLLNNKELLKMPYIDLVIHLNNLPKTMDTLTAWTQLVGASSEQLPKLGGELFDTIFKNKSAPSQALIEAVSKKTTEFNDWYRSHQELQNARSILVVWEKLVLAVPEEHRQFLEGPGLINLASSQAAIDKAKEFSAWFKGFKQVLIARVTELNFAFMQLTVLPDEICELTGLQKLDLFSNQLTALPIGFGNLTQLQELSLGENQFTSFPDQICKCTQLWSLDFHNNRLPFLPPEIDRLIHLEAFNFYNNQLTSLPWGLLNLPLVLPQGKDRNPLSLNSRILVRILSHRTAIKNTLAVSAALAVGSLAAHSFGYL